MFWQYLVIIAHISIGTGQLLSDNGSFDNPFASIEPSTSLIWTPCYETTASPPSTEAGSSSAIEYECARLLVPFEYSSNVTNNATDSQFSIAMLRSPATDPENYKGPIFFNFGGPGGPGTLGLREYTSILRGDLFAEIMSGYDLVSFDPRGVGNTLPAVSCFTSKEDSLAFSRSGGDSIIGQSNESFIVSDAQHRLLSDSCADNAAELIPFIGTVYVVEDLRRMVEVYGYSDKLNFFGVSYGSLLGMTYAATYPDGLGKMILDSIVDPVNAYTEIATPEYFADGEAILQYFFRTCFGAGPSRCPFWFDGPEAIAEAYNQVDDRLRHLPFIANDENGKKRMIEWHDLQDPVLQALYDPDAVFPQLARDLAAIYNNDSDGLSPVIGNPLPSSIDLLLVDPDTQKPNGIENVYLIRCADTPEWLLGEDLSFEEWQEYILGEEVTQYGRFASFRTEEFYGSCGRLSINPPRRFEGKFTADNPINTTAPILFLSMRLDPATPLSAAFSASSIFTNSAVAINENVGHAASRSINECLGQVIGQYLIAGILPENGTACEPGPEEGGAESLFPAEGEAAETLPSNSLDVRQI